MQRRRDATRRHLELTTVSLLAKREAWERLGHHLPEGGMLIVMPQDSPISSRCLLKVAQAFRNLGREVRIHTI